MKLTGPMMSLQASGPLAGTLTFQNRKGRPTVYLKQRKPKQLPDKTIRIRLWVRALMQAWPLLSSGDQAAWSAFQRNDAESPINAYIRNNIKLICEEFPVRSNPNELTPTSHGWPTLINGTGGVRHTEVDYQLGTVNHNWFMAIHRNPTTPFTQTLLNTVAVFRVQDNHLRTFFDSPLAAGPYYYKYTLHSTQANKLVAGMIKLFTVT